jgi:hypothetical protein
MHDALPPARVKAARILALSADLLQIALLPAFVPGAVSPANNVVDLVVALALVRLIGWHWAFLPTFLAEMVPVLDLVPTWTAAVFLATRGRSGDEPPEVVPVEPARLPPGAQDSPRGPSGA